MDQDLALPGRPARPDSPPGRGGPVEADGSQLSVRVLTITLALSLWIAGGALVLAITDGLGPSPVRRLVIGVLLVLAPAAGLWWRHALCAALRVRPWLVVVVALVQLAAAAADGIVDGPFVQVTLTSIGLASVVARPRTVWVCVALLDLGCAAAILVEHPPSGLVDDGHLAGALGALLGYAFAALVVLGLAGLFAHFVANADGMLDALRSGRGALTPALAGAVVAGTAPRALLARPSPFSALTPREVRVVEQLADGARPKEIAAAWGLALATIRKDLRLAKQKTGARTLPELAAMTTWADWPGTADRG